MKPLVSQLWPQFMADPDFAACFGQVIVEHARMLRQAPSLREVPVIALTAHALSGDRQKALDAGCTDYETKPVEFARLLAKLEAYLGGGRP